MSKILMAICVICAACDTEGYIEMTCGPWNCPGCCDGDYCLSGYVDNACGLHGQKCEICGGSDICNHGQCEQCTADCSGQKCGYNECGIDCGTCEGNAICLDGLCVEYGAYLLDVYNFGVVTDIQRLVVVDNFPRETHIIETHNGLYSMSSYWPENDTELLWEVQAENILSTLQISNTGEENYQRSIIYTQNTLGTGSIHQINPDNGEEISSYQLDVTINFGPKYFSLISLSDIGYIVATDQEILFYNFPENSQILSITRSELNIPFECKISDIVIGWNTTTQKEKLLIITSCPTSKLNAIEFDIDNFGIIANMRHTYSTEEYKWQEVHQDNIIIKGLPGQFLVQKIENGILENIATIPCVDADSEPKNEIQNIDDLIIFECGKEIIITNREYTIYKSYIFENDIETYRVVQSPRLILVENDQIKVMNYYTGEVLFINSSRSGYFSNVKNINIACHSYGNGDGENIHYIVNYYGDLIAVNFLGKNGMLLE